MRQASYAARNAALLQRGMPHAARKSARVFLYVAQPPRAASCSHRASGSFLPHRARRLPKYPLKAQSHPARGCTRSSAKLSVFSKPRYFSPISKSAVKNSSAESFSQQRRKYSLSSSFSCFSANNSKSHTARMPHPRAESALSCGTKGTKTSRSRQMYKFLRPARKRFPCAAFHAQKRRSCAIRIVFRERRAVQF